MSDPVLMVDRNAESRNSASKPGSFRRTLAFCCGLGLLFLLLALALGPMPPGNIGEQTSSWMQTARQIGLMMAAYANDHDGNYPNGKSSTEVFQKLIDEGYCTDPALFYIPLAGKIPPDPRKKLKPENVSFDVTSGIDANAPGGLAVVFMTGYHVTYAAGGAAIPVIKPYPRFGPPRTWTQWRYGYQTSGLAVMYKNNSARFWHLTFSHDAVSVPDFVPQDFDAKGKIYRQLTPGKSTAEIVPIPPLAPTNAAPVAEQPWVNKSGAKFVPAGTHGVLFCIWDVRVKDFRAFVDATGYDATKGMKLSQAGINWKTPGFAQTDDDPVVKVSWNDANAFCQWLTTEEQTKGKMTAGQRYRLPTDAEWSAAVGLSETVTGWPGDPKRRIPGIFPWGTRWPPPNDAGNFNWKAVNYESSTLPVGNFAANQYGLYDMSGNVWQWCEDEYGGHHDHRVLRGGSWSYNSSSTLLSSFRLGSPPDARRGDVGFRMVVDVAP